VLVDRVTIELLGSRLARRSDRGPRRAGRGRAPPCARPRRSVPRRELRPARAGGGDWDLASGERVPVGVDLGGDQHAGPDTQRGPGRDAQARVKRQLRLTGPPPAGAFSEPSRCSSRSAGTALAATATVVNIADPTTTASQRAHVDANGSAVAGGEEGGGMQVGAGAAMVPVLGRERTALEPSCVSASHRPGRARWMVRSTFTERHGRCAARWARVGSRWRPGVARSGCTAR
jgi:hypothetical protein